MARQIGEVGFALQLDFEYVPGTGTINVVEVFDLANVGGGLDHALGEKKAGCEFFIVTGRPHHDGNALSVYPNFQRLLGGDEVIRFC